MASAPAPAPARKAYPPPPFALLHSHVTSDLFGVPFPTLGAWGVNITAPTVSSANNNYATLGAYVRGGYARATAKVCCPHFPKGLSLAVEATRTGEKGACLRVEPTLTYKFEKEGDHTVGFTPQTGKLTHAWAHPSGALATDVTTELADYLNSSGSLIARLYPGVIGGFDFVFDPTRSGLKQYKLGLKYKGTHSVSYDAEGTVAASTIRNIVPGRLQTATHMTYGRKGGDATVGLIGFSPCGAKIVAKVAVRDGAAGLGTSRMINGEWRINVGAQGNLYKRSFSGVGVSFNYEQ